ncbi:MULTISPECIES: cache domain-containing protein [unclassified Tatumella]|uniref:cache domain-containing protein n=1 Tax=unclassified Tatumella TaxID=2649542 RepID=UPI001BB0272A|nr:MULTISPECIES: cache domain-containing protein [unclassified Tatumella]MBS0876350.1 PDC sensor domain-containing protein [Tatumella sp. JGM82]MBS0889523.1 PDC sensor domain-containing protein [Tatumella sp. JGM94]MBS0900645.1 PDC sensor domain-containing protein [Tatumella sp. JGM100]
MNNMLSDDECKKQLAEKTGHLLQAVTASAQQLSRLLAERLTRMTAGESLPQTLPDNRLRKTLFPAIEQVLTESDYCFGAGFASHQYSAENHQPYWFLEWWFKSPGSHRTSCLELDQATQQRLDFSTFDWFKQPQQQTVNLHGPYVDYICTSAYTMTASSPVITGGRLAGVAVVDMLVSVIEAELLTLIRQCRKKPVIINRHGRVMVSSHPGYRTGSLVEYQHHRDIIHGDFFRIFFPEA